MKRVVFLVLALAACDDPQKAVRNAHSGQDQDWITFSLPRCGEGYVFIEARNVKVCVRYVLPLEK